jgi:hypothetical protein
VSGGHTDTARANTAYVGHTVAATGTKWLGHPVHVGRRAGDHRGRQLTGSGSPPATARRQRRLPGNRRSRPRGRPVRPANWKPSPPRSVRSTSRYLGSTNAQPAGGGRCWSARSSIGHSPRMAARGTPNGEVCDRTNNPARSLCRPTWINASVKKPGETARRVHKLWMPLWIPSANDVSIDCSPTVRRLERPSDVTEFSGLAIRAGTRARYLPPGQPVSSTWIQARVCAC